MSKHTSIRWYYGDLSLQIDTADVLSPEGIETIVHRTGREFTHRYRELDEGADLRRHHRRRHTRRHRSG